MIVYHRKKSGQELKAGSWRLELMQKLRRMDAFSWFAQPARSRLPGPAAQVWHHLQWEAPSHVTRQSRECSTGWATGQSYRDIFSVTLPSSQVTLTCVKVTQKLGKAVTKPCYLVIHPPQDFLRLHSLLENLCWTFLLDGLTHSLGMQAYTHTVKEITLESLTEEEIQAKILKTSRNAK